MSRSFTTQLSSDLPASLVVFLVAVPLCLGIALASGAPLASGTTGGGVGGDHTFAALNHMVGVVEPGALVVALLPLVVLVGLARVGRNPWDSGHCVIGATAGWAPSPRSNRGSEDAGQLWTGSLDLLIRGCCDAHASVRRIVCAILVIAGMSAAAPLSAQTIEDGRVWWNVTLQERAETASPWRWYVEVQGRMRDGVDALDQLLVRPAIAYDLTGRSSVWIGYGYTPAFPASGDVVTENRAWQQYLWNRPGARAQLALRSRAEERAIEDNVGLAWRFRQQVRLTRVLQPGRFTAILWDEIFFHVNSTRRTARGLDQNRIFGGVGVSVSPATRVEIGYMNQYINSFRAPARSHHILSGVLNVTF